MVCFDLDERNAITLTGLLHSTCCLVLSVAQKAFRQPHIGHSIQMFVAWHVGKVMQPMDLATGSVLCTLLYPCTKS